MSSTPTPASPAPAPRPASGETRGLLREARRWFVTSFLVFALLAVVAVIYALQLRPMEFFYVLF